MMTWGTVMSNNSSTAAGGGIGLGGLLAVLLSWTVNHSVLWCILHFLCGWFYVGWYLIVHSGAFK